MSDSNLRTFTARFPDIERLAVQSSREREFRNILPHITLLTTGTEGDPVTGLRWPKLKILAISAAHIPQSDKLLLPGQINQLQQLSDSFRKLLVPPRFFDTAGAELTARLEEFVGIEDLYDDWPTPFKE
ncbi:hypothetical protein FIBSPDRAFT_957494 [Athelia psychrophila]|uniref:Uncharacterized protein n=1 Tax=Athelia psychrophila TaxID=1759441 RepID=A0A166FMG1_9AGAM|nr:hypothetical protein FIBSPDRAFT_957494 [Fibularhizoctonia sp. CBS 109695]